MQRGSALRNGLRLSRQGGRLLAPGRQAGAASACARAPAVTGNLVSASQ